MPLIEQPWVPDDWGGRFDRAIEWLLVALLVFMPLAFGAVQAWSEEVVVALTFAICAGFLLKITVAREAQVLLTWAYIPILVFILVAVLQLIALPVAWVRLVSPQTAAQKMQLLSDISGSGASVSNMRISFYPYATWHDLRLVFAGSVIFVVVLNVFRRPDQIVRLLWAIAIIGAGVVLVTLAQVLFGNGEIYWLVQSPNGMASSGPFVNHSHYAQFMNLSVGATLGVVFTRLHERFKGRFVTPVAVMEYLGCGEGKRMISLSLVVALGMASIFVSLSRGGMISLMIAGGFTALVVSSRASLRSSGWVMVLLALAAFICVLYVGFGAVYDRLGTLRELDTIAEGGRWQIVKDIAGAWTRFPVIGTGLGTHEVVYPMFDRSTIPALATHAENEYAQAAEETGIVGLLALLALGAIVWGDYVRVVRTPLTPVHSAAYGLGFGLLAIMIHSLSDFGQHLPSNAFLSVIFCALLIRLRHVGPDGPKGEIVLTQRQARRYGVIGLVSASVVFGGALSSSDAARRAEVCWAKVMRVEREMTDVDWQAADDEYVYLLSSAAEAQEYQPANMQYRYWLNVYRWRAISRGTDPNVGPAGLPPECLEFADRIVDESKQAVTLCPVFGSRWSFMGHLERSVCGRQEEGAMHILIGRRLAPCDPATCVVSGMLYAEGGGVQAAFREWQRAVKLDRRVFAEVSSSLVMLGRADLACELAGDDVVHLIRVEEILRGSGGNAECARGLSNHILERLEKDCQEASAPTWKYVWLAQRYRDDGRIDKAIQMYHKALAVEYGQVSWRFSLAQMLAEQGSISEAIDELETCLRLRPQSEAALGLLESLSVRAGAGKNPDPW